MTVIAWDGRTLAADKQSTSYGLARTTTKVHRLPDGLLALSGGGGHAYELLEWFKGERQRCRWPRGERNGEDTAHAIHFSHSGILVYDGAGNGFGELILDKLIAFGSGRDYAMAAMHLGCTAVEAVEVACHFDVNCGMGIDSLNLEEIAP